MPSERTELETILRLLCLNAFSLAMVLSNIVLYGRHKVCLRRLKPKSSSHLLLVEASAWKFIFVYAKLRTRFSHTDNICTSRRTVQSQLFKGVKSLVVVINGCEEN